MHVLCQELERQVTKEMQQVTEYFGEGYDATDPAKVLRVIRDFMMLFDKSIFEIKVCVYSLGCKCLLIAPLRGLPIASLPAALLRGLPRALLPTAPRKPC